MKLSNYTAVTHRQHGVFVTGLLTRSVFELDLETWSRIQTYVEEGICYSDIEAELYDQLVESLVLVEDDFDELGHVMEQTAFARAIGDTFGLVIVPTMGCNMNCHYCFEDKSDTSSLSRDTVNNLVAFASAQLADDRLKGLHVRWFGGEPLNNLQLMEDISGQLKSLCLSINKQYTADVVTNGFQLTKDVAAKLASNSVNSVQITFEGDREYHNRVRFVGQKGSYDQLIDNILASSDFFDIRLRIHVAPHTFERIKSLLSDLAAKGINELVKYVYFAPLFNYDQNKKDTAFNPKPKLFMTSEDFAACQVELHRLAKELGFSLPDPLDSDYGVCTALREYTAVVNPDGSLAKCYMDAGDSKEVYGNLRDGKTNESNQTKWRKMLFANDEECRQCKFAPVCLGGCAKQVMSGADKDVICTPLKFNINELVPIHYGS